MAWVAQVGCPHCEAYGFDMTHVPGCGAHDLGGGSSPPPPPPDVYSYEYSDTGPVDDYVPTCVWDCSECVEDGDYECLDDCTGDELIWIAMVGCPYCETHAGFDMSAVPQCASESPCSRA